MLLGGSELAQSILSARSSRRSSQNSWRSSTTSKRAKPKARGAPLRGLCIRFLIVFASCPGKVEQGIFDKAQQGLMDKLVEILPPKLQEAGGVEVELIAKSDAEQAEFFFEFLEAQQAA